MADGSRLFQQAAILAEQPAHGRTSVCESSSLIARQGWDWRDDP